MTTYQVSVINPKADKLLQDLADLKLISITETSVDDVFLKVVARLRTKAESAPPSMEEIIAEVEAVRARRYAQNKA